MCRNPRPVDQSLQARFSRLARRMARLRDVLSRQGSVVASWRGQGGRRMGPYYRLAFRKAGRQVSIYLGCCAELVDKVRALLAEMQAPTRLGRTIRRGRAVARRTLRACNNLMKTALASRGLYARGWKVYGWRRLQESLRASRAAARSVRAALGRPPSALGPPPSRARKHAPYGPPSSAFRPPCALPLPCLGRGLP